MMRKLIPLTALVLGLSGGVALADRDHGRGGDHGSGNGHRAEPSRGGDHRTNVVVRGGDHRGNPVVYRGGGGGGDHRGNTVVVRDNRNYGGYRGNYNNNGYRGNYGGRVVVNHGQRYYYGAARHPIYVSRPAIRYRYYNYYQRPALLVENYSAMPGYYWVPGAWSWTGYEWTWQPGHYEPDSSYIDAGYYDGY